MTNRLAGKVAFITGATSGIGRSTAVMFARQGATVAFIGRREQEGRETLELIQQENAKGLFIQADVTEPEQVSEAIERTVSEHGGLDILMNNAGGSAGSGGDIANTSDGEFWQGIKLNLFGTWLGCRSALPAMIANGGGSIINVASVMAILGSDGRDVYTAAKGGIISLTRSLAYEYAKHKIRVNTLIPGAIKVERSADWLDSPGAQALAKSIPLGFSPADDIAYAAVFLGSDESRTMTGQEMIIDGGMSTTRNLDLPKTIVES